MNSPPESGAAVDAYNIFLPHVQQWIEGSQVKTLGETCMRIQLQNLQWQLCTGYSMAIMPPDCFPLDQATCEALISASSNSAHLCSLTGDNTHLCMSSHDQLLPACAGKTVADLPSFGRQWGYWANELRSRRGDWYATIGPYHFAVSRLLCKHTCLQ